MEPSQETRGVDELLKGVGGDRELVASATLSTAATALALWSASLLHILGRSDAEGKWS